MLHQSFAKGQILKSKGFTPTTSGKIQLQSATQWSCFDGMLSPWPDHLTCISTKLLRQSALKLDCLLLKCLNQWKSSTPSPHFRFSHFHNVPKLLLSATKRETLSSRFLYSRRCLRPASAYKYPARAWLGTRCPVQSPVTIEGGSMMSNLRNIR